MANYEVDLEAVEVLVDTSQYVLDLEAVEVLVDAVVHPQIEFTGAPGGGVF